MCPQVTLEVCGDSGHLVRPKAGQISSWEGHGGSHLSYTATKLGGVGVPQPGFIEAMLRARCEI